MSARLLMADVPTSTSVNCACLIRCSPSVAESAMAADAPQIATAPPDSVPKAGPSRSACAVMTPARMVRPTMASTASSESGPSAMICASVMRTPTSTIAQRSRSRLAKARPGASRGSLPSMLSARPISSASSVSGAP